MKFLAICLITLFISSNVQAFEFKNFKLRARENIEVHNLRFQGNSQTFTGLSNTLSFGHEIPFKHYYAISVNPFLTFKDPETNSASPFGEEIRLVNIGIEGKQFFDFSKSFFVRGALAWSQLTSDDLPAQDGFSVAASAGYEFYITKTVTLAPEIGYRRAELENDISDDVFSFTFGIHFYGKSFLDSIFKR